MTSRSVPWPFFAVLTATSLILGLQVLRAAQPQLSFLLRDRFGWPSPMIGLAALALFAVGFLVAPLASRRDVVPVLVASAGLLGLARLGVLHWEGEPVVDLVLAVLGVAAFFIALGVLPAVARSGREVGGFHLAFGLLFGLVVDLFLLGLPGSVLVPSWPDGPPASIPPLLVAIFHLAALMAFWRRVEVAPEDLPAGAAWAWAAIGPFLMLHGVLYGNPARLAAILDRPIAPWWLLASAPMVVIAVLLVWRGRGHRGLRPLSAVMALGLVALASDPWPVGSLVVLRIWIGSVLAAGLATLLIFGLIGQEGDDRPGFQQGGRAHGVGLIAWAVLIFSVSAALDLRLPFDADLLIAAAAAWLGLGAWIARPPEGDGVEVSREQITVAALLALVVLGMAGLPRLAPEGEGATREATWPVRVLSYNIHCGVTPAGAFDLEAQVRTIESVDADLVALQEVSRGWPANGAADMATWLGERLGFSSRFHGTADPTWGNAILGRWRPDSTRRQPLPSDGLLIGRGALAATFGDSPDRTIRLISTHLHHPRGGSAARLAQVKTLIELWGGRDRTVIAGDFNARPDAPEIEALRAAGLIDAFAEYGVGPGKTFRSGPAHHRIDYIWLSPDLIADEVRVLDSPASDHLPVLAVVRPRSSAATSSMPATQVPGIDSTAGSSSGIDTGSP